MLPIWGDLLVNCIKANLLSRILHLTTLYPTGFLAGLRLGNCDLTSLDAQAGPNAQHSHGVQAKSGRSLQPRLHQLQVRHLQERYPSMSQAMCHCSLQAMLAQGLPWPEGSPRTHTPLWCSCD